MPCSESIEPGLTKSSTPRSHCGTASTVEFAEGEEIATEISAKFRRERAENEFGIAGFEMEHWWTDSNNDFALSVSRPGPMG